MASPHTPVTHTRRFHLNPLLPRDPAEPHRAASALELFFDLVFVIAVSMASSSLHEAMVDDRIGQGIASYLMVFFAIWWAWMNFTWFATSFDNDDWLYRVTTFIQMSGVLILAAGIPPAFEDQNFLLVVIGYVVMRLAMVSQWLRASRIGGAEGRAARAYATGITIVQLLWVGLLFLPPDNQPIVYVMLILTEITVPVIAEKLGHTPWNPRHIVERYGLFTLILMGESLLASANAIIEAIHDGHHLAKLIPLAIMAFAVTACLWWIYFWPPHPDLPGFGRSLSRAYGHYAIFAAAGALSAGIESEISSVTGHSALGDVGTSVTVTLPIAIFMMGVWLILIRPVANTTVNVVLPLAAALVFLDPLTPLPTALCAVVLAVVVGVLVAHSAEDSSPSSPTSES